MLRLYDPTPGSDDLSVEELKQLAKAKKTGILVIDASMPVAPKLPEVWKRWCLENGKEHRVDNETWVQWAKDTWRRGMDATRRDRGA